MPSSRSVGSTSSSMSRANSEYSLCTAVRGWTPWARRMVAAAASERPMKRTMPAGTSSPIAPTGAVERRQWLDGLAEGHHHGLRGARGDRWGAGRALDDRAQDDVAAGPRGGDRGGSGHGGRRGEEGQKPRRQEHPRVPDEPVSISANENPLQRPAGRRPPFPQTARPRRRLTKRRGHSQRRRAAENAPVNWSDGTGADP